MIIIINKYTNRISQKCCQFLTSLIIVFSIFLFSNYSSYSQFTSLYTMNGGAGDGYIPDGNLVYDGTFLYGTNNNDFFGGYGTIFKIKPDGTGFTKIHQFSGTGDERQPSGLLLIGSTLYGTANVNFGNGIIYKINTDGTGYSVIFQFDGPNYGKNPSSKLVYYNSQLYGVTFLGGSGSAGVIFKMNLDGSGFTKIHEAMNWLTEGVNYSYIIMNGSTIYVTAAYGGACSCGNGGTLFKINSDGTGYQTLIDFNAASPAVGVYPGLISIIDNKLIGGTGSGLSNNAGAIFSVNLNGTNLTKILEKGGSNPLIDYITGYDNNGNYVVIGNATGGTFGQGYFFWMNTDGSNFNIMNQTQTSDNGVFKGEMLLINNTVYGNLSNGGAVAGEIYKFILPSTPDIQISSANTINTNSAYIETSSIDDNNAAISDKGFVWSLSPNPTISNYSGISSNGTIAVNFNQTISDLYSNTVYYVRAFATNYVGTNYSNQITFTTEKTEEDYAPNNGDGNNDGILDSRQSKVHSLIDLKSNSFITIESVDGLTLNNIEQIKPYDTITNHYYFNLLKFKVAASEATIKIYYHYLNNFDNFFFRKLNSNNEYFTFKNIVYSTEKINDKTVVVATLKLTDGGFGDYDGLTNGEIIDPGAPVILVSNINIPTLSEWARIILLSNFALFGVWWIMKKFLY